MCLKVGTYYKNIFFRLFFPARYVVNYKSKNFVRIDFFSNMKMSGTHIKISTFPHALKRLDALLL